MEDRLLKLLDTEQLSSSKFADIIGVQRSSVSHILSGRNKPSFDFIQKTLKAFPLLNADWLIIGDGDMYDDMTNYVSGGLFDQKGDGTGSLSPQDPAQVQISPPKPTEMPSNAANIPENTVQRPVSGDSTELSARSDSPVKSKALTKVILFYDDNSFHTYEPES
jgi:transcriptional regulator with XRE-family HTH domain